MATHKAYVDDSGHAEDPSHSACSIAGFVDLLDMGVLGVALTDVNTETEMKHAAT